MKNVKLEIDGIRLDVVLENHPQMDVEIESIQMESGTVYKQSGPYYWKPLKINNIPDNIDINGKILKIHTNINEFFELIDCDWLDDNKEYITFKTCYLYC